jgi:hypothetical protein
MRRAHSRGNGGASLAISLAAKIAPRKKRRAVDLDQYGLRWIADEWSRREQQNYEAVNCLACGGVHLVNPVSGKTIGEDDKSPN